MTFFQLFQSIQTLLVNLMMPESSLLRLVVRYRDLEGDLCVITNTDELQEAFRSHKDSVLKLEISFDSQLENFENLCNSWTPERVVVHTAEKMSQVNFRNYQSYLECFFHVKSLPKPHVPNQNEAMDTIDFKKAKLVMDSFLLSNPCCIKSRSVIPSEDKIKADEFEKARKILRNHTSNHCFLQRSNAIMPYQSMYLGEEVLSEMKDRLRARKINVDVQPSHEEPKSLKKAVAPKPKYSELKKTATQPKQESLPNCIDQKTSKSKWSEKFNAVTTNYGIDYAATPVIAYSYTKAPLTTQAKAPTPKEPITVQMQHDDKQYQDHLFLVSLIQMGFTDAKVNLDLLRRTNGNLASALKLLLRS